MNKKCQGCGAILQQENEQEIGYVPNIENSLCKRCFRLRNYNELISVNINKSDFEALIKQITRENALYIVVIDIFTFSEHTIRELLQVINEKKELIFVINKIDLLPHSITKRKLEVKLTAFLKEFNLNINQTILISALKSWDIDEVLYAIDKYREGRNVYFIGAANSGKSTLLNRIISAVLGERVEDLSVSNVAGTTLSTVKIPLSDDRFLIDTPGLILKEDISQILSRQSNKIIELKKEVRPQVYQIYEAQSFFLTGLIQIDFPEVYKKFSITIYISPNVKIHRTKYERAETLRNDHLGDTLFQIPTIEELKSINFKQKKFTIKNNQDILINSIGWINVRSEENLEVKVTVPEISEVELRKPLI